MRLLVRLVRVHAFCAALLVAGAASAQGPSYLHRGQPVALDHAHAFLSVGYAAAPDARGPRPAPRSSSHTHVTLGETEVIPSVTLLWIQPVTPSVDRRQAARVVRQDVLADPAVAWAYPALVHPPSGQLLLLTNEIVVKVRGGTTPAAVAAGLPGTLRVARPLIGADDELILALVDPKADDPLALANALAAEPWVEWTHPNFLREYVRSAVPDDPMFPQQWHLQNTGQGGGTAGADADLVAAWDVTVGSPDVVIAIIDDGVVQEHPDLARNLWTNPGETAGSGVDGDGNGYVEDLHGWDFVRNGNDTNPIGDRDSHGTAAAGVAAARGGDGGGVTGACQRCRILPVKIFHGSSFAGDAAAAEALRYAANHADVLSNSWGGGTPSAVISSGIEFAATRGRGGRGAPVFFAAANGASGYLSAGLDGLTAFTIPAGTWIFEWEYLKNESGSRGFDTAWLDNVAFPDGTVETFEACRGLPSGWTTAGPAGWQIVDDPTRAASARGGRCAAKAGTIGDSQSTTLRVQRTVPAGTLSYNLWVSAETFDGGDQYSTRCLDGLRFSLYTPAGALVSRSSLICGNQSNQLRPLQEGVLAFPASEPRAIAVGASTNFDTRSDYSQWGTGLWMVAPSSGGSVRVTTTSGPLTTYRSDFGGTSSAAALAAGVTGLLLSREPALTEADVRDRLRRATRKIGGVVYDGDGWNNLYGYGALSARLVVGASDYSLAPSRSLTLAEGASGSTRIDAVCNAETSSALVSFAASGLPAGATAAFAPAACVAPCSTTLTVATVPSTPSGSYAITVTGQPLGRQTTFTLNVARSSRR
jgi:subtilisin family serine protease